MTTLANPHARVGIPIRLTVPPAPPVRIPIQPVHLGAIQPKHLGIPQGNVPQVGIRFSA